MSKESEKKETVETPEKEKQIAFRSTRQAGLLGGFDSIFDDFRRSFDDLMSPFLPMRTWVPSETQAWPSRAALVDLVDDGEKFLLRAELPRFEKADVVIMTNKNTLTFKAEKKSVIEDKKKNYLHRERTYSSSRRTINFPEEVDPSKVVAKMNNGILEILAPKKEPEPDEKLRKIDLQ
jgi:HSP20 family protein